MRDFDVDSVLHWLLNLKNMDSRTTMDETNVKYQNHPGMAAKTYNF